MSSGPTPADSKRAEVYLRPRGFVAARGPDAARYLNRMVSNEVAALAVGTSCEALLLTPKARVIAPLLVYRRADDDFLLFTEPGLDEIVTTTLLRTRFAAKVSIEVEEHESHLVFGSERPNLAEAIVVQSRDFGAAYEVVGAVHAAGARVLSDEEADRRRIEAGLPRFGSEIDDRVLPAEAGLVARMVDFEKGCYPGQEPIARLHYRGHTNRGLRVLLVEDGGAPPIDAEVVYEDRVVGRITSTAVRESDVVALGYVRNDVPDDAVVQINGARASIIEPERP